MNRTRIASSHEGRYSYWSDPDNYVYQFDERLRRWARRLCHVSAWDHTFSRSWWITLA